jgi:hypothetical protein
MEGRVSKGFLIFAQNTATVDYIQQAYALSLSIKYSQHTVTSVSLVTNDSVDVRYRNAFDNIIAVPWTNSASALQAENRWKLYHVTPYDDTIVLDADMLMLEDITSWWEYCSNYDLKFCSTIKNYKLDNIVDTYYRKTFIANGLTNPYAALHYFKKSEAAYKFYKVLEFVCNNWENQYGRFSPNEYQNWLSMDLSAAIAIEITGMYESVNTNGSPLEFIHMKAACQGWSPTPVSWQDTVPYILTSTGELIVGNIKQSKLFHYVEKTFITPSLLSKLERTANGT